MGSKNMARRERKKPKKESKVKIQLVNLPSPIVRTEIPWPDEKKKKQ